MTKSYPLKRLRPDEISERAKELNKGFFVNVHDHMMFEFAIRHALGEKNIFDTHYLPILRAGNIDAIATTVGANSPNTCNLTDWLEFGAFEQIDMLRQEEREGASFKICTTTQDFMDAKAEGKIGIMLSCEGSRAFAGRYTEESLVMLRTFYELGLRMNCICGGARTVFGDGVGDIRANAGLTTFGVKHVEEMNRLGIIIDLPHMTDNTFFDVMEVSTAPVLVSHVGVQHCCPSIANLSDERIKAIGKNGGLIGMEMVKTEILPNSQETAELVTFDHVVDHIDHIAELVGPEHVCIGLDFDNFDLVHNVHRAMAPFPGSIEGFPTGIPKGDHMLDDPNKVEESYVIADYLVRRGYSDEQIAGILGKNALRLFKAVIG